MINFHDWLQNRQVNEEIADNGRWASDNEIRTRVKEMHDRFKNNPDLSRWVKDQIARLAAGGDNSEDRGLRSYYPNWTAADFREFYRMVFGNDVDAYKYRQGVQKDVSAEPPENHHY